MKSPHERALKGKLFDHDQHRKHNKNIEAIDKKMGIGKFDPKNFSKK